MSTGKLDSPVSGLELGITRAVPISLVTVCRGTAPSRGG